MRILLPLLLSALALASLLLTLPWRRSASAVQPTPTPPGNYHQATFAAGCFWGGEEAFRHLPDIIATWVAAPDSLIEN